MGSFEDYVLVSDKVITPEELRDDSITYTVVTTTEMNPNIYIPVQKISSRISFWDDNDDILNPDTGEDEGGSGVAAPDIPNPDGTQTVAESEGGASGDAGVITWGNGRILDVAEDGLIKSKYLMIIPYDGYTMEFSSGNSVIPLQKGIYLYVTNQTTCKEITFNNYTGFARTKQLDDKYLPNAHELGTVVCTSSNVAPKNGEWVLIDKEFKARKIETGSDGDQGVFAMRTAALTSASATAFIAGHTITLRLGFTNKNSIGDSTDVTIGTIGTMALGVTTLPAYHSVTAGSDGGKAVSLWNINGSGEIVSADVIGSTSLDAGSYSQMVVTYNIANINTMLDEACDRFYWVKIG